MLVSFEQELAQESRTGGLRVQKHRWQLVSDESDSLAEQLTCNCRVSGGNQTYGQVGRYQLAAFGSNRTSVAGKAYFVKTVFQLKPAHLMNIDRLCKSGRKTESLISADHSWNERFSVGVKTGWQVRWGDKMRRRKLLPSSPGYRYQPLLKAHHVRKNTRLIISENKDGNASKKRKHF